MPCSPCPSPARAHASPRAIRKPICGATTCSPMAATWLTPHAGCVDQSPRFMRGSQSASAPIAGSWKRALPTARSGISISPSPCGWIGTRGCNSTARTAASSRRLSIPGITAPATSRSSTRQMPPRRRPLGADGHFYRRQIEGFADTILHGAPMRGADAEDGVASIRAMVAIARSVETGRAVRLDEVSGAL